MSGIYIHIPFCRQACHYCNFHFSTSLQLKQNFVAALINEIKITPLFETASGKETCNTIYFGGGTPSLLETQDLLKILAALHTKFSIASDAEITFEANPDDITPQKLNAWKHAGINRLSVGIQSFQEAELVWMNRAHSATDSLRCLDEVTAAGFTDYSIDLIYGSPLLTDEQWQQNVSIAIKKNIPHLSCYALTVEPKTALDKMIHQHKKQPVDPERQAQQFLLLTKWMEQAGYEHYEISNFAKPGKRSKHNSSYWQGKKYYGFGPSAHAYDGKSRRWNVANNALYIQALQKNSLPYQEEILTETQRINEYIMTSLRTIEGIDLAKINSFGKTYYDVLMTTANKYLHTEKLMQTTTALILTREGKLFADGIAADLFFE